VFVMVLTAAALVGAAFACGRVPGSSAGPTPTSGQTGPSGASGQQPVPLVSSKPPPTARQAVSVQLKAGTDPNAVGARVLGPDTFVRPAWRGSANPPKGPAARRTFLIPVAPEQEQAALSKARSDPDVERAQLVSWPPDFP
jgi:hypothetical protein